MKHYEVIVIGGGPAGLTAAIYLKRAGHDVAILEKYILGGKVNLTAIIDNYPGISHVSGPDFAYKLYEQVQSLNIAIEESEVIEVQKVGDEFVVIGDEEEFTCAAIVVASGTRERKLNVPGEDKYYGRGVSYCAICDGPFYKDKIVAVIGGGNSAFEESAYLASLCQKVYLIHRSKNFIAEKTLIEEVFKKKNIEIIDTAVIKEIQGDQKVNKLIYLKNDKEFELKVDGVFPFIGTIPNTQFLEKLHILDPKSYVIVNGRMETEIEGLFAAGDVIVKEIRQIVTATSDGAIAATTASRYLKKGR